jgi:hypothetical protein
MVSLPSGPRDVIQHQISNLALDRRYSFFVGSTLSKKRANEKDKGILMEELWNTLP